MDFVSGGASKRARIEDLLARADQLDDEVATWQNGAQPSVGEIRGAQRAYSAWFAEAQRMVADEDRPRFLDMYEGGPFTPRIRAFLSDPLGLNPLVQPGQDNPLLPKWQHPYDRTLRDNLAVQRQLLVHSLHATVGPTPVLDELTAVLRRLPEYLDVLRRADSPRVPAPSIERETDLQVLVHALLRLHYDDVRPEDPVSQHAGGGSRVDFLLRETGVVIETKMTRPTLTDRKLGEELSIDWNRYPRHPDCTAILAFVYDPGRHLANPSALEHDLSQDEHPPATRVVVVR